MLNDQDIMSHAGLTASHEGSSTNLANNNSVAQDSDSDDRVALAQALLQRCLQKDTLLCELYMQLIKQVNILNSSNLPCCMISNCIQVQTPATIPLISSLSTTFDVVWILFTRKKSEPVSFNMGS